MDSVILLNKPTGMTSFDAVAKCRRILHEKKTGHTGTLDPNASGLMIVLTGKYTKLLPYCKKDRKVYHAEFSLGKKSDTGDIWGTVLDEKEPRMHTKDELEEAAASLTGNILQVPPMYSAIRKDGKRLYEYARKGIEIEREARPATVFSLDVHTENGIDFTMDATVSSGTYVRTLITDFAEKLGEYAVMTSLVRTGIDGLTLSMAATFESLEANEGFLDPLAVIAPEYEIVEAEDEKRIRNGMTIRIEHAADQVILVKDRTILAAYEKRADGFYHCLRGLF
ncbi:MAG: tRNA pseudouridine(55) synthase TruB [Solobacterium sp.]|nr:tRNA pseudouridine(55) synthase TruB [Solobacterium sp.]